MLYNYMDELLLMFFISTYIYNINGFKYYSLIDIKMNINSLHPNNTR